MTTTSNTISPMEQQERIQVASNFLLQAPPGEINDVLNDVRDIIADDAALQAGALPALEAYNLEQFITADVPDHDHQVIVSDVGILSSEEGKKKRFIDPRSKTSFVFDHLTLEASDPQPYTIDEAAEPLRNALDSAAVTYLANHFVDGVASVFPNREKTKTFRLQIVANKYKPENFWSGRWRSEYVVDFTTNQIRGKILVNVHYYEQGNVQLEATHNSSIAIPSGMSTSNTQQTADTILALIEAEEGKYQASLNSSYQDMAEKTFKSLRRALPMTRQKLDWDRVLGYKLGAELTSSRNAFGTATS